MALKKFKESQLPSPTPPLTLFPSPPPPQTLPSVFQPSNFPGPSYPPRRSRSPVPIRESHRDKNVPSQCLETHHVGMPGRRAPTGLAVGIMCVFDQYRPINAPPAMTSPDMVLPNSLRDQEPRIGHLNLKSGHKQSHSRPGWSSPKEVSHDQQQDPTTLQGWWDPQNPQSKTKTTQEWWDPSTYQTHDTSSKPYPAAHLSAAPASSHSKPLTAFSHDHSSHHSNPAYSDKKKPPQDSRPAKTQGQEKPKHKRQPKSREATLLKDGEVRLNYADTTQDNLEKKVKFALNHKSRMKAACELCEETRLQPLTIANEIQLMALIDNISNLSADIPEHKARLAANILAGACLLDTVDISRAQVVNLPTTHNQALIIPMPEISQFTMPEPFKSRNGHTWALLHGTSVLAAQCILLEGFTRPADWTYHQDYTGGASFQHSEHTLWDRRPIGVTPTLTGQLLTCCWTEPQRKAKDNFRCSS